MNEHELRWFQLHARDPEAAWRELLQMEVYKEIETRLSRHYEEFPLAEPDAFSRFERKILKWTVKFAPAAEGDGQVPVWGKFDRTIPSLRLALLSKLRFVERDLRAPSSTTAHSLDEDPENPSVGVVPWGGLPETGSEERTKVVTDWLASLPSDDEREIIYRVFADGIALTKVVRNLYPDLDDREIQQVYFRVWRRLDATKKALRRLLEDHSEGEP